MGRCTDRRDMTKAVQSGVKLQTTNKQTNKRTTIRKAPLLLVTAGSRIRIQRYLNIFYKTQIQCVTMFL